MRPTTSTGFPTIGIVEKASVVSSEPLPLMPLIKGCFMMQETRTRPVIRQTTTVSQKVPVIETSACRLGLRDWAAAATSGAEPIPDSFEKSPRAIPNLQAEAIVLPIKPPPAARGVNAAEAIVEIVCAITSAFIINIIRQPST